MNEEHIEKIEYDATIIDTEEGKLDILNRDQFIGNIIQILQVISETKGTCALAINGKWGSGKSFVLDKLEYNLKRYQDGERYLVFHYNCWQYDYYEEPLMAIVSSLIDGISNAVKFLPETVTKNCFAVVKSIGRIIFDTVTESSKNYIKAKTGIDIGGVLEQFNAEKEALAEAEADTAFDDYKTFNMMMAETRLKLAELAEDITVVFVVDEMDRCLPTYAIKVMERLHHLFYGIENTVTIMAVDKNQLENTIRQIYGQDTSTDEYLKKFINYELVLDTGKINDGFVNKYSDYVSMFNEHALETYFDIEEFYATLFDKIDIRTQERLMEKIKTIHLILYPKNPEVENKDYSFMCFELFLLYFDYFNVNTCPIHFKYDELEWILTLDKSSPKIKEYMAMLWQRTKRQETSQMTGMGNGRREIIHYDNKENVSIDYLIFWFLYKFFDTTEIQYIFHVNGVIEFTADTSIRKKYNEYLEEFKKIYALLKVIK